MSITIMELQSNLEKYLLLAETEDVFITRDRKVVAKLSNPHQDRIETSRSLFGILPAAMTFEEVMEKRIEEI